MLLGADTVLGAVMASSAVSPVFLSGGYCKRALLVEAGVPSDAPSSNPGHLAAPAGGSWRPGGAAASVGHLVPTSELLPRFRAARGPPLVTRPGRL